MTLCLCAQHRTQKESLTEFIVKNKYIVALKGVPEASQA